MNALAKISPSFQPLSLLYQAFVGVREAQPLLGLTGWSRLLATSEGELQASRLNHEKVWPLEDVFSLFYLLSSLGEVEVQTFNNLGWAKYQGRFNAPDLCLDDPQHLELEFRTASMHMKLDLEKWYWGCAVEDRPPERSVQRSLQFFNYQGKRFLKIHAVPQTDELAWHNLITNFAKKESAAKPLFAAQQDQKQLTPPADMQQFSQEWRLMSHAKQLSVLLRRHQADYLPVLQHLDAKFAREVSLTSLSQLLKKWTGLSDMTNKPRLKLSFYTEGCMQAVSGVLQPPRLQHNQLCIAYADGCVHCDPQQLEEAFVVRKPEGDGWVTSLEIFNGQGQLVLKIQEEKPECQPENLLYREIFQALS
ncbi:Putative heme degradation protein [Marinospirillum celere]|uniref:Putative heme degradation protein n=1 Tax=Marinospirillum celere TaxID=1122252 RepID=A0A1I1FRI6_9GAMM|nr:ChuX/HutX family heme-like substrate-binding protein [Marinospirillum celere]SFC02169.1 Putative heme degradation protein [Marinospirillum celere]